MSSSLQCFVAHCNASKDSNPNLNFFPLPKDRKFKETWLALTGRKVVSEEQVHFCESHFRRSASEIVMGRVVGLTSRALPYHGMPQMICRTCMTTISHTSLFCVVSGTIPSPVPPELATNLIQCRPEPLLHILTFCIPNLSLEKNPPSLVCIKCYHNIWQYFIFKLTCNSFENKNRGSLSPEEYGKLVRCRACPETSGTRFYFLSEGQPMCQVFKNIFLSNYPTHVVPLKLCLKCWNKVYKLTEFHQQCVTLDQMIQRCKEINRSQAYHGTSTLIGPSEMVNLALPSPSTSSCPSNSNFTSINKFSTTSEEFDKMQLMEVPKTQPKLDFTNNNLYIGPEVKVDSEPKQNTAICPKNTMNFVEKSRIVLANLMLKHSQLLKPGLNPIEKAKCDLEMWVNVVVEFRNLGYTHTLESMQYTWSKMKNQANFARKSIGPMTYLDYLVLCYITGVNATDNIVIELDDENNNAGGQTENICIASSSNNAIQRENCKTLADSGNKHITDMVGVQNPTSDGSEIHAVSDDYDVICMDDIEIQGSCSSWPDTQLENDCDANVKSATLKNCDISIRKDGHKDRDDKTLKTLLNFRFNKGPKVPRGNKQKSTVKRKHRTLGKVWNHEQKLEFLQEIRKEYNRLIENEDLSLSKCSPWKFIIERIALRGFKDYNFSKLYYQWGKVKMSAMVHEKNGVDIVDNEAWELLQLHSDVQKNLSKSALNSDCGKASGDDTTPKNIECEEREMPTPSKKQKLFIPTHSISNVPISSYPNPEEVSVSLQEESNSASTPVSARRSYIDLSEDENLEILELIEEEFNKMLSNKGVIYEPLSLMLNRIKYKNYSANSLLYNWQKLRTEASVHGEAPTPIHKKVQKLLKIYRENRSTRKVNVFRDVENSKQKIEEKVCGSSQENSTETSDPSIHKDKKKLDLISVIRSFGNEVFKTDVRSKRTDFWVQVTAKFRSMGYNKKPNDLCSMWGKMLRSAKLTWAQEDRKPCVGDQEIIDFMTEVIREKEKSEMDSKLNLSVEENEITEDSGSFQEGDDNFEEDLGVQGEDSNDCVELLPNKVKESVDNVEDDNEVEVVKIQNNSESSVENVVFDDYEYVSFEDIKKHFKISIMGESKLDGTNEVIEIMDSDEE